MPYALFAYCGLLFWTHFATSLTTGTNSLVVAAPLIKKCAFPRETIPLSKVLAPILDLFVAGGRSVGVPTVPGLSPNVDLDGDGLERFETDEDGGIARCVDGDGTVEVHRGRARGD